jgi:hypothetical protein
VGVVIAEEEDALVFVPVIEKLTDGVDRRLGLRIGFIIGSV